MTVAVSYQYAIVRLVPRVERGECLNVGVVLFCRTRGFLRARVELDEHRLLALDPHADVELVRSEINAVVRVAMGDARAGRVGMLDASERFGWLVAPSSTMIQTSPVHNGLCHDPETTLARLHDALVRPVTRADQQPNRVR